MTAPIVAYAQDGVRALLVQNDDEPSNPRTDCDQLGVMVTWHGRYRLGDEQPKIDPDDYLAANVPAGSLVLPLFLFDHSGISIRADDTLFRAADGAGWDWGKVGFIYVTPEKMRENFGAKRLSQKMRATTLAVLRAEVKEYDQYLTGDVYAYQAGTINLAHLAIEGYESLDDVPRERWSHFLETEDSCCGMYGYDHATKDLAEYVPEDYQELAKGLRYAY